MTDTRFREVTREGLRPLLRDVPVGPSWNDITAHTVQASPEPARSGLIVAVGSAVAVFAVVGVLALLPGGPPSSNTPTTEPSQTSTTATTTTSLPSAFPAVRSSIGLGWESVEIPSSLVAPCHRAMVGTDTELIFWGGDQASCDYEFPTGDPGMAYNPGTGVWRQLPASPLGPAVAPTGVWTGSEVVICCGMASRQAAAYDPQEDTWRSLAQPPLLGLLGPFPKSVWSGTEMFVVSQQGAAAYNPTTDVWRRLPSAPESLGRTNDIVWTGSEIVVWPVFPDGDPLRRVAKGMAFNPTAGTWRVLPDPPAWPSWLDMVFTGDSIIIWGGLPAESGGSERAVGSRLDLRTNTWTALPEALPEPDGCECNLGSQTLTWTGEYVLVSPGMFSTGVDPTTPVLIAYNPESNTWILVDDETPLAHGGISLTVGERLVIAVGSVFYLSPPNWQPTGDTITENTWSNRAPAVVGPPPASILGFQPNAVSVGGRTAVDVTFTDGRRVSVEFPSEWRLEEHSWSPQTRLVLEQEDSATGWSLRYAGLSFSYSDQSGWAPHVMFRPEWTDEEKALVPDLLDWSTEANGFVTVRTTRPLSHFTDDPDQGPIRGDIDEGAEMHIGVVVTLTSGCHSDPATATPSFVYWCDVDSSVAVHFRTDPRHFDFVLANFNIVPLGD